MIYCDDCFHRVVCGNENVGDEAMTYCSDKMGWILVSGELPENGKEVLTCSTDGFIEIQSLEHPYDLHWENQEGDLTDFDEVIAWMPLLTPFKKEQDNLVNDSGV